MTRHLHFVDAYTEEWWKLRRGIPTASQFHRIVTAEKCELSKQHKDYVNELIAERLVGATFAGRGVRSNAITHGIECEPDAIDAFGKDHNVFLDKVGFVTERQFNYRLGSSPDCLVRGSIEPVEIKCPLLPTLVGYHRLEMEDYKQQVQGHMLVGEFEVCHFWAWHPSGPPYYLKTYRDESYIAKMRPVLDKFCDLLDAETERVRDKGTWVWKGEVIRGRMEQQRDLPAAGVIQ